MIALSAISIPQQGWNDTLIQCVENHIESTRTSFCTDLPKPNVSNQCNSTTISNLLKLV